MKKLYAAIIIFLLSFSTASFGQVVVNEGFEHAGALPAGWTATVISSGTNWVATGAQSESILTVSPHTGSYQMWYNSYGTGSGGNAILVTPVIDWSGRGGVATTVTVWIYRQLSICAGHNDNITVYVNTSPNLTGAFSMGAVPQRGDIATSGTNISGSSTVGSNGWYQYTFTIPVTYNSSTNYIIFQGNSTFGASSHMDDVQYTTYPCIPPVPGTITGTTTVCAGATTTLADPTGTAGGTWTSASPSIATVGSSTGVVTGVAAGTAVISYQVVLACGTATATTTVTVNPVAGAITGTASACTGGNTSTLSSTPAGGTWSSGSPGVATIGPSSGVVTTVSPGTSLITYAPANGCASSNTTFTVNALPTAITGTLSVCATQTTSLSSTPSGGTWTSSNTGLATVGSSSGIVTGVAAGNPLITYTSTLGCITSSTLTVNPLSPITGTLNMCLGFGTNLSDATPGGTWTSGNTGVATINSLGAVSSVSLGAAPISYTIGSTGCRATTTVNVTNPPNTYVVTGGGAYCAGGSGVNIGVSSSDVGVSYTLFNGATQIGLPVTGTGALVSFGLITGAGTYNVIANFGSPCAVTMSGSATVAINPLPTGFTVSGGGSYCSGGTGVHVFLSSSTIGVNYQLMYGVSPIGAAIAGTGTSLDFGAVTSASLPNYTVIATDATTFCTNTMTGSAAVSINPLPTVFTITGGGSYCLGGTGVAVGLSSSVTGFSYQLFYSGSPLGAPLAGTGSALSYGLQTGAGNYTVVATNTTTGCTNNMSGTAVVVINALPTVFTVTGGGSYCLGGAGVTVGLNASTIGVNYQLYRGGTPVGGALLAGTGVALNFGLQTVAGSYTVVASNATTGCSNNMFGSASVTINPLPAVFSVTGGGGFCAGGTGVHVGLASSVIGTSYQLLNGATVVGAAGGTGGAIDFGLFTAAGVYTVVGTITSTGCVGNMAGSVTITVNPLPNVFTVTGGGNYCATGTGVAVGLSGSNSGINYQLYNGVAPVGSPVAGSGSAITFGLQTAAGAYSVIAINTTTTCTNNMAGSVNITINPLPTIYGMTGGGGYCTGGTGVNIGLTASDVGTSYQLKIGGLSTGPLVPGTGFALSFGLQTAAGTYTVTATNTSTACASTMAGSVTVVINSLPTVFTVSGSGNYCTGGAGLPVLLSGSASGVNYQLYNGVTTIGSPMAGTGAGLNFGPQTAAGTYTVVATNATTGCVNNMTGSAVIGLNPLPAVFTVIGGGSYCAGGSGTHVGLSGSVIGTTYQLYNGVVTSGLPVAGTGTSIDFGFEPTGTYTVVATITATSCTNNMSGSATVTVNPLPGLFTISGGGNYCSGGTGLHIGLGGSAAGVNYQLYNGLSLVGAPVSGTGGLLDFGLQTAAGTYTVAGTSITTGCSVTMTGTTSINILPLPALHNVTGGGSYCPSGTGVSIGLNGSNTGFNYQLYNGATAVGGPMAGSTGLPVNFGLQTAAGIYTVLATNTGTGCSGPMTGSALVSVYSLPVIYNVSGGGNYCAGGTGVTVSLSGSGIGVNYQLYDGSAPMGAPVTGTGVAISFGPQTTAGTYTVVAMGATSGCTNNMNGSVVVGINPLPALHTITGGGNYCTGGTGVTIGLNGSDPGTNYQLYNGVSAIGTPVPGTGAAISFGLQAGTGSYTVKGVNTSTGCTNVMTSSVIVATNALPIAYAVSGGGAICSGGPGMDIFLGNSEVGNNYQLFRGATPVGAPMGGTGAGLDFGPQTAAGTYTVVATSTATGCSNAMTGSVTITVNPLPTAYTVSGGGSYCSGGAGLHILLSGSNTGITYQLYNGVGMVGAPMNGTGGGLDFGLWTAAGAYTVVATNTGSSCTKTMTGSVTITVNPLPTLYTVVSTSSNYCVGGTGVDISLTGSDVGTTYQLYNGVTAIGSPIPGNGSAIDFGYILPAGSYTVAATITATGCTRNMAPGVTITVNPLPTIYTVTGGGQYCAGGSGVHIGLSGSNAGVAYQLYNGVSMVGSAVAGTGLALDFGPQMPGGTYTVMATNVTTTCTSNMAGTALITINPAPVANMVTGGGSYCAGGTGVAVGLGGSTVGVNYQLYKGLSATGAPMAGTGGSFNFGMETGAGTYTVVATDGISGCSSNMLSSAVVVVNPLPAAFTLTGGGGYCPGGSGVHVGISGSVIGVTYQLYNGVTAMGTPIPGSGSGMDFGLQTAAGTYTIMGTNTSTGCSGTMTGSSTVVINTLPVVYMVVGGGNYCAGGTGVHVGINNSSVGVNYTLYNGVTAMGTLPGTGGPLDYGFETMAGTYTVLATDATTTCSDYMSGSVTVTVNAAVTPFVSISTGAGDTICSGTFTTFTALAVNGGGTPGYQWTVNGVAAATGGSYSYIPLNGDVIRLTMTSSAACAVPAMVNTSVTMTVDAVQMPFVNVSADPGRIVCQGTTVTYTAAPTYGGTAPTYLWKKNGITVGTAATFSYVPANNDIVSAVMTSNYHCRSANTVNSNNINMEVDISLPPVVTITPSPSATIAPGQLETLVATVSNGGPAPTFQWVLNSVPILGANGPSYSSSSFVNGDSVSCEVVSSGGCAGLQGGNSITIHVVNVGVTQIAATGSDIQLVPNPNKGTFTVKGTLGTAADEEVSLEVTNMLGQVVYTNKIIARNGEINEKIQIGNTPANGMYILTLRSGTENKVFHMVIEQ